MIQNDTMPEVETSGIGKAVEFSIKLSAKAFRDLYSSRYSRKIEAVIRELSTNAYDSHVAAGKPDVPFRVHLPNKLEPWFEVQDFGTGMSYQDIHKTYIVCFESNRDKSNDFTGGFGLGSKSPFAICDNFTTTVNYNGVSTVYSLFINSEGIPSLSKMGAVKTSESNGVSVKISVADSDFNKFKEDAEKVLSLFSTRPIVEGNGDFAFKETEYLFRTPTVGLYKTKLENKWGQKTGTSRVIMANVAYPLEQLSCLGDKERGLISWGIDLFVPNGTLQPTTSREAIEWNKASLANITKLLAEAKDEIAKLFEKEAHACQTLWEARRKAYELHSKYASICDCDVTFNGAKVSSHVKFNKADAPLKDTNAELHGLRKTTCSVKRINYTTSILADDAPIFIDDLKIGPLSRINYYINQNRRGDSLGYVLTNVPQAWLDETGISEVAIKTSSLPKPPATARSSRSTYGRAESGRVYTYKGTTNKYAQNNWKATPLKEVDRQVEKLYVELDRFRLKDFDFINSQDLHNIQKALAALTGKAIIIYGIRTRDLPKLPKWGNNWKPLRVHITEIIDSNKKLAKSLRFLNTRSHLYDGGIAAKYNVPSCQLFRAYKVILDKSKKAAACDKCLAYKKLLKVVNSPVYHKRNYEDVLDNLKQKIEDKFPLLDSFANYHSEEVAREYLGMMVWKEHLKMNPMVF